jgi:hypothetical protein
MRIFSDHRCHTYRTVVEMRFNTSSGKPFGGNFYDPFSVQLEANGPEGHRF